MQFSSDWFTRRIASQLPGSSPETARRDETCQQDLHDLLYIEDDKEFLQASYARILGRPCDISGMVSHLESLRNHVPRRVVLQALQNSDEAKTRRSAGKGGEISIDGLGTPGFWAKLRGRILRLARNSVNRLLLVRFDSIDHKLMFLLQELASRSDALSQKTDHALWTLSEKLDSYFLSLKQANDSLRDKFGEHEHRVPDLAARLDRVMNELERLRVHSDQQETATGELLRDLEQRLGRIMQEMRQRISVMEARIEALNGEIGDASRSVLETGGEVLARLDRISNGETERLAKQQAEAARFLAGLHHLETQWEERLLNHLASSGDLVRSLGRSNERMLENANQIQQIRSEALATRIEGQVRESSGSIIRSAAELREQLAALGSNFAELHTDMTRKLEGAREEMREFAQAYSQALTRMDQQVAIEAASIKRRVHPPVFSGGTHNILATEVEGFLMGVPAEEWRVAAQFAFRGVLEPGLTALFKQMVRPGMIVVDVGANIGIYTLLGARLLNGQGKVHSFEPTPRTRAILRDNVQVNGFLETGIIEFHDTAVTDEKGFAQLTVFPDNSGHNTLFWDLDGVEKIPVPTISLDDALASESHVDVVKIDAEGAEPRIIRGMRETIRKNPSIRIVLEFSPSHLKRAGINPSDFLRDLEGLGFETTCVDDLTGELKAISAAELCIRLSSNIHLRQRTAERED